MRVGAMVRCYGSTQYLGAVLKHLKASLVDRILVLNVRFDGVSPTKDDTAEIARSFGVEVYSAEGLKRADLCNIGMNLMSDCDYVFYNDADEFVLHNDMDRLLAAMIFNRKTVGTVSVIDYATNNTAFKARTHKPHYLIKQPTRAFLERCFDGDCINLENGYMHHMGYFLSPDVTTWKRNNLWYDNPKDYYSVVDSETRPVDMPVEIAKLLEVMSGMEV